MAGVPAFSVPKSWVERELARRLPPRPGGAPPRVIRWGRTRGLVRIDATEVARARVAWNDDGPGPDGAPLRFATRRSWGTLRKGKVWLAEEAGGSAAGDDGGTFE